MNDCTVTNCVITTGSADCGGLMGYGAYSASVTVTACTVTNCVITTGSNNCGGLIGFGANSASVTVTACTVTNCVITTGSNICGGLIGYGALSASVTVTECTVTECTVYGNNGYVGGLIGSGSGTSTTHVDGCNVVDTTVLGSSTAGLVQTVSGTTTITNCDVSHVNVQSGVVFAPAGSYTAASCTSDGITSVAGRYIYATVLTTDASSYYSQVVTYAVNQQGGAVLAADVGYGTKSGKYWTYGDGVVGYSDDLTHMFTASGTYTSTLKLANIRDTTGITLNTEPFTIKNVLYVTPSIGFTTTPYLFEAKINGYGNITYQWQVSTNGLPYTNLSVGTTYINETFHTDLSYTTTLPAGMNSIKLIITYEADQTVTSDPITVFTYSLESPDTILKQSSPDISTESTDQYHVQTQYILPGSPNKLLYIDQYIAYLATGNAVYKIQSDTNTITSVSSTTGNTIQNAYLGTTNAVITDTDNTTALYDYASGTQTYLSGNNTGIIASTTNYAAVKNNSGQLNLYHAANGTYINSTSTSVTQIAANDQTNIIIGHVGTTTLYIWKPSATTLTQTTTTLAYAITDIKQIPGTNQFLITTTSKSYILAITETGAVTTTVTSTATTALQHTQSTTTDTFIGTNTNGLYIIDNTGTTIGTYTAGATLNDASIARLTGLWAVTGGDDTQAYFLTKSGTSSWTLGQTAQIMNPVSHTQMSSTGTYALICTGTSLYLFKNTQVSTTLYYLSGIVISSAGIPWQNQTLTMNGETIVTDSSGKFVQLVTPGTTYTFVADTTTTQYTCHKCRSPDNSHPAQAKPLRHRHHLHRSIQRHIRKHRNGIWRHHRKNRIRTWSIYDTSQQNTVYTHRERLGTETYPISHRRINTKTIQVTCNCRSVETPSVKNHLDQFTPAIQDPHPINLFGLDDTGRTIIFCAVLMIFGGLFGVLHSTKGALAVTALPPGCGTWNSSPFPGSSSP